MKGTRELIAGGGNANKLKGPLRRPGTLNLRFVARRS